MGQVVRQRRPGLDSRGAEWAAVNGRGSTTAGAQEGLSHSEIGQAVEADQAEVLFFGPGAVCVRAREGRVGGCNGGCRRRLDRGVLFAARAAAGFRAGMPVCAGRALWLGASGCVEVPARTGRQVLKPSAT